MVWNAVADYGVPISTPQEGNQLLTDCTSRFGGVLKPCNQANWPGFQAFLNAIQNGQNPPIANLTALGDFCCWKDV
jgi:hypothetical protein